MLLSATAHSRSRLGAGAVHAPGVRPILFGLWFGTLLSILGAAALPGRRAPAHGHGTAREAGPGGAAGEIRTVAGTATGIVQVTKTRTRSRRSYSTAAFFCRGTVSFGPGL